MKLTAKNYYSRQANEAFFSTSQVKALRKCEAAALAELRGEYVRPQTTALLVGGYVDAYYEGSLDTFIASNPEVMKRDGSLKAEFVQAGHIVKRLEQDRLFHMLLSGRKQVIRTGKIAGYQFKIKMDSLLSRRKVQEILKAFPGTDTVLDPTFGAIVDLKIMRDMGPVWSAEDNSRVPFVEAWGYDLQGAVYQAVEGNGLPFVLAVGTKEDATDLAALTIPDERLTEALYVLEDELPHLADVKFGRVAPTYCGRCPYCRSVKRLDHISDYREVC